MTSATEAVQAGLVAALRGRPALMDAVSGVYDGPPARARFPYVALAETVSGDWSHKSGRGREQQLAVVVWDDGSSPSRLHRLMAEAEDAIEAVDPALEGHRLVSLRFIRARVVRDAAGPWAGVIQYRARTLEE